MSKSQHIDFKKNKKEFSSKLAIVPITSLQIDRYPKVYLKHLIEHRAYYLDIYETVITNVLKNLDQKSSEMLFIDFGSGNGLLGIFAAYLGFGKVVCIDIDHHFCLAGIKLANTLGIENIKFINGSEAELKNITSNGMPVVITGTDVIEHIYNLDHFFTELRRVDNLILTVFTTACNSLNPWIVKRLTKHQITDELIGRKSTDNDLLGNGHLPFFEIRKQIISKYQPDLSQEDINKIAKASRGLNKTDIENLIDGFLTNGILVMQLDHPTNTCDPITGSWSERILSIQDYNTVYTNNKMNLQVQNGFYNSHQKNIFKKVGASLINRFILFFHQLGMRFAPFIILIGKKNSNL